MKIDFLYTKFFTVALSICFVFGLSAVFLKSEVLFSALLLIVLILFSSFKLLGNRKIVVLYLIFFLGLIRVQSAINFDNFMDKINSNSALIAARVVSSKNISNSKVKFYIEASEIDIYNKEFKGLKTRLLASFDGVDTSNISLGDKVLVKGKIRTPSCATNPYQFDYKNYLLNNNTKFILYADSIEKLSNPKLSKDLEEDWYYILKKFEITRNKILQVHAKNIKSPRLEILGGIVFGNETINPDEEIKESFKNSGLLHLLAASGLNVALIYGIWWWIANLVKFPYHLSIALGALFVIFYTFMTGFPPSILRASLMLLFVLFGKLIDRSSDSIALIFFVGFLILLFNPKMLFDVGFQLSFAVTFGLIFCCPVVISKFDDIEKRFIEKHKKLSRAKKYFLFIFSPKNLASIVAVPLIAQIWVIPLQMHYFNNFAPCSVLANIAVVPFVGILSFIGFVSSIIALVPYFSEPVVFLFDLIANPLLALLIKISSFFSSFKFSLITTSGLNFFQIFTFWGLIILFTLNLKRNFKSKKLVWILLVCAMVFLFSFLKPDYFKSELEISMFDVGNADSFLIKTPKNKFILIDTGKKTFKGFSSGETVINRYFKNERINKLNLMIITHFDSDHSGGALDILKENRVDKVFIQKEDTKTATAKEILDYLKNNKIDYKIAKNAETIYTEPNLKVQIFTDSKAKTDNEASIITLLTYKNKNYLFMADADSSAFRKIEPIGKVEILKVGHHGARGVIDNYMLDKIKPEYALISTGINKFNHPHYTTIALLNKKEIKTLSSLNWGFIKIKICKKTEFYHFDSSLKKLKPVLFDRKIKLPFNKTDYVQDFIKANL